MSAKPIEVVRSIFEWFDETPFELLLQLIAEERDYDEAVGWLEDAGHPIPFVVDPEAEIVAQGLSGMGATVSYEGRDDWVRFWREWWEPWEAYELRPSNWAEFGDRVIVDALNIARGAGSGVVIERLLTQVWTVREGRITHLAGFEVREEALASIGAD